MCGHQAIALAARIQELGLQKKKKKTHRITKRKSSQTLSRQHKDFMVTVSRHLSFLLFSLPVPKKAN